MSTIEDFENAPVGATATTALGNRAMKMIHDGEPRWVTPSGFYRHNESMVRWGYTLDSSAPTTAREALDLAWDLAHEVKEGQVIPVGAWLVDRRYNKIIVEKNTFFDIAVDEWGAENIRTLDPLPDPEPDWLDAPAVLAHTDNDHTRRVWAARTEDQWASTSHTYTRKWRDLRDVTPLYPKETE